MQLIDGGYYCPDCAPRIAWQLEQAYGSASEEHRPEGVRPAATSRVEWARREDERTGAAAPMVLPTSGFGVASLILGIIGVILFFVPFVGAFCSLLAIFFGSVGIIQTSAGRRAGAGLAWAGLILGVIGLLLFGGALFGILRGFDIL